MRISLCITGIVFGYLLHIISENYGYHFTHMLRTSKDDPKVIGRSQVSKMRHSWNITRASPYLSRQITEVLYIPGQSCCSCYRWKLLARMLGEMATILGSRWSANAVRKCIGVCPLKVPNADIEGWSLGPAAALVFSMQNNEN